MAKIDDEWMWDLPNNLREFREKTLLTNFDFRSLPIYKQALKEYIKKTNDTSIYIKKYAYDIYGNLIEHYMSLHTDVNKDLTKFWDIFNNIRKQYPNPWHLNIKPPKTFKDWNTNLKPLSL